MLFGTKMSQAKAGDRQTDRADRERNSFNINEIRNEQQEGGKGGRGDLAATTTTSSYNWVTIKFSYLKWQIHLYYQFYSRHFCSLCHTFRKTPVSSIPTWSVFEGSFLIFVYCCQLLFLKEGGTMVVVVVVMGKLRTPKLSTLMGIAFSFFLSPTLKKNLPAVVSDSKNIVLK